MTLFEEISGMLTEISAEDAYAKFYNKVPKEEFDKIVNAYGKFDAFVKFILKGLMEDLLSTEECLEIIEKYKALENKARIMISDKIKSNEYTTPDDLIYDLDHQDELVKNTKSGLSKNGYAVLYENENWILTCTFTYEANHKYFGHTQWCTASDRMGRFDGYVYFKRYSLIHNAALFQITSKKNKNEVYQAQVDADLHFDEICDIYDNRVTYSELKEKVGNEIIDAIRRNVQICVQKTEKLQEDESEYQAKIDEFIKQKKIRLLEKRRLLVEKCKELNNGIKKKIMESAQKIENESLYMNIDFIKSLSHLSKFYTLNGIREINKAQKYIEYANTHNNAFIAQVRHLQHNIAIMYIVIKSPNVYVVSENRDNGVPYIEEVISSEQYSYLNENYEYCSKGFAIVVEMSPQSNPVRVIRKIYDVDVEASNVIFDDYRFSGKIAEAGMRDFIQKHTDDILFFTIGNNGCIYTPSNGKLFETHTAPAYFTVSSCGYLLIYSSWEEYFMFTKDFKLIKHEISDGISKRNDYGTVINDKSTDTATFYVDNDIFKNGVVKFDKQIQFVGETTEDENGHRFFILDAYDGLSAGIVIDNNLNKIVKVFDFDNGLSVIQAYYSNEINQFVIYGIKGKNIICCELPNYKYTLIVDGKRIPCDRYGNKI